MTLRCQILAFAVALLPAGFVGAQNPTPKPVEPAPAKQERPAKGVQQPAKTPVQIPAKTPAKKDLPSKGVQKAPQAKPTSQVSKKAGSQPASQPAGGKAAKAEAKTAKTSKKTGKKSKKNKKAEAEAMKKVTINIGTKDAQSDEEVPIPEGANEADIRAIRGANAMLKAEKQLKQILKNLKVKGGAVPVPFRKIDSWTYEDGFKGMPKDIRKLDGKRVIMAGFMLPIYEVENIKTFYLVKSLWSCCYGIPPDVNGLVRVEVKKKGGVNYQYDPIFVVGTFHVKEIKDEDYTVCLYEIVADDIRVLDLKVK